MKERPILFSGAMVRAILAGQKTQTRRVCKPADFSKGMHPGGIWAQSVHPARVSGWIAWQGLHAERPGMTEHTQRIYEHGFLCPYGAPGDRLWVRETWQYVGWGDPATGEPMQIAHYKAARNRDQLDAYNGTWRPSIHMPRWASRITLEVVGVRVERLAEITNGDAYAEGCRRNECAACNGTGDYDGAACGDCAGEGWHSESDNFRALWNSINAARGYGWEVNPWVWVVEFKRV